METNIIIKKSNEAFVKIDCDRSTAQELSDYFTFYVPGFQFTPAYRNKIWDGKIRLFNLKTNELYHGLFPLVENFANERDYKVSYANPRPDLIDHFSEQITDDFIKELNLHSKNKPITVDSHQRDAFMHSMTNRRCLILSPTASGKSLIMYLIVRQLLNSGCKKGLVIVPRTSLVEQLFSDFIDYSSHNDWNVPENIHRIYQGKEKITDLPLIITTWQSVYQLPKEYFQQFDFVLGDEAHLFKSQSLTTILSNCTNARYRIGLTGSLDGTKTHKLVLEGLFGLSKRVATTKQLMEKNRLSDFEIKCLILKHDDEICERLSKSTYQEEIEYLILNRQRNKFIKNLSISLKGNTLILYQYVDKHGKILYDMISQTENIGERKIFFVYGKTDVETRENVRSITEKEKDAIIIASYGTFSTGINIRNLHNVIFASPSKSRVRNLQSIGRALRIGDDKEKAILYDIADDLRHKKRNNYTLDHFIERVNLYNEEKFSYKIYKIGLKNANNKGN